MDSELIDLVKEDKAWMRFIVSSTENYSMDNWELLSELEYHLFQKCLLIIAANENYSKAIEDSGLDKNSIINYMIQD